MLLIMIRSATCTVHLVSLRPTLLHFPACSCQVRNRNSEEYNVLKLQLESIIDELERHFEQASRQQPERQLSKAMAQPAGQGLLYYNQQTSAIGNQKFEPAGCLLSVAGGMPLSLQAHWTMNKMSAAGLSQCCISQSRWRAYMAHRCIVLDAAAAAAAAAANAGVLPRLIRLTSKAPSTAPRRSKP
jgi:hypothetical protein